MGVGCRREKNMADKSRLWASIKEELGSGILNALNDIRQRVVEEGAWGRIATPAAGVKPDATAGIQAPKLGIDQEPNDGVVRDWVDDRQAANPLHGMGSREGQGTSWDSIRHVAKQEELAGTAPEFLPPKIDDPSIERRYTGENANHFAMQKAMHGDLQSHDEQERTSASARM
jgi:hypothetical protein